MWRDAPLVVIYDLLRLLVVTQRQTVVFYILSEEQA